LIIDHYSFMSRLAKRPLLLPAGVTATMDGRVVRVKGPKGELFVNLLPGISVVVNESDLVVNVKNEDDNKQRATWGLIWALLRNVIVGVSTGYTKQMEINGVGYKATMEKNQLVLRVGYSHPVNFTPPAGVAVTVDKNIITVTGIDKQLVGQAAANIREIREPEPYKGKGIKYIDEVIRRKAGKVTKAAA
jgi:large subunit ribosomal protein L6